MSNKRIFISGKIGTYKVSKISEETIKKFQNAETELNSMFPDCHLYNPVECTLHLGCNEVLFEGERHYFENLSEEQKERYIKNHNIRMLTESTSIYLLTDWRSSAGANFEKEVADFLGLEIIYQKEK